MAYRTTIVLDDESRAAARELAHSLNCSTSEAIRRAVIRYRDLTTGASEETRRQRSLALRRLIDLFDGDDVEEEIQQRKAEDAGL